MKRGLWAGILVMAMIVAVDLRVSAANPETHNMREEGEKVVAVLEKEPSLTQPAATVAGNATNVTRAPIIDVPMVNSTNKEIELDGDVTLVLHNDNPVLLKENTGELQTESIAFEVRDPQGIRIRRDKTNPKIVFFSFPNDKSGGTATQQLDFTGHDQVKDMNGKGYLIKLMGEKIQIRDQNGDRQI